MFWDVLFAIDAAAHAITAVSFLLRPFDWLGIVENRILHALLKGMSALLAGLALQAALAIGQDEHVQARTSVILAFVHVHWTCLVWIRHATGQPFVGLVALTTRANAIWQSIFHTTLAILFVTYMALYGDSLAFLWLSCCTLFVVVVQVVVRDDMQPFCYTYLFSGPSELAHAGEDESFRRHAQNTRPVRREDVIRMIRRGQVLVQGVVASEPERLYSEEESDGWNAGGPKSLPLSIEAQQTHAPTQVMVASLRPNLSASRSHHLDVPSPSRSRHSLPSQHLPVAPRWLSKRIRVDGPIPQPPPEAISPALSSSSLHTVAEDDAQPVAFDG